MAITSVYLRFTNVKNTQTNALETLNITNDDICPGGLVISKSSTTSDSIEIGAIVASEIEITLRNTDEKYSNYNFENSVLHCSFGNEINEDNSNAATYYIDNVERTGVRLKLFGYDSIIKLDKYIDNDFSFTDSNSSPLTVANLIAEIREKTGIDCGLDFLGSYAENLNYKVRKPKSAEVTYRQLLSWCAQILGTNGYSSLGGVALSWYTDQTAESKSQGYLTPANRYCSTLENEIKITGIYLFDSDGVEHYAGEDRTVAEFKEYALTVSNNELVDSTTSDSMLANIWSNIQGFKFSPFEATVIPDNHINIPPIYTTKFIEKDGKEHIVAVTDYVYTLNRALQLAGKGTSQTEKSYIAVDAFTQEQIGILKKGLIGYKVGNWDINKKGLISSSGATYAVAIANYENNSDTSRFIHCYKTADNTDVFYIKRNGEFYSNNGIIDNLSVKELLISTNNKYIFEYSTTNSKERLIGLSNSNNIVIGKNTNMGNMYLVVEDSKKIEFQAGTVKFNDTTLATGSDARIKSNIENIDEKYKEFFKNLRPVTFKYNNGRSGRLHVGFIAQEVFQALEKSGLTDRDFAGYVKSDTDNESLGGYELLLRYSEFIALNTFMIQRLAEKIEVIERGSTK